MSSDELFNPPDTPVNWDDDDALDQLRLRLQTAVLLEMYTIPLYLFSYYSIKDDQDDAAQTLLSIVKQEMLHLALAGNILCAIGGDPKLYKSQYVPRYPTKIFIEELNLNLEEPTEAQIRSFVQLERPPKGEAHGFLDRYHTIGQFYEDIETGLKNMDENKPGSLFHSDRADRQFQTGEDMIVITDLDSAMSALKLIVEQGEGLSDGGEGSHYRKFTEMLETSIKTPIDCYPVVHNPVTAKYAGQKNIHKVMLASDAAYTYLLLSIEESWRYGNPTRRKLAENINTLMRKILKPLARFLVTQPLEGPDEDKGKHAAPPFNRYDFDLAMPKSAYSQLKDSL